MARGYEGEKGHFSLMQVVMLKLGYRLTRGENNNKKRREKKIKNIYIDSAIGSGKHPGKRSGVGKGLTTPRIYVAAAVPRHTRKVSLPEHNWCVKYDIDPMEQHFRIGDKISFFF